MKKNSIKNRRLFSKALFKQSCKANSTMWGIVTFAVCFTLASIMLISGTSNISLVKEGIQDTIIEKTIESNIKKSAIDLYITTNDAEYIFDKAFMSKIDELNTYENYLKIKKITDTAESKATNLVSDYVKDKITVDVEEILEEEVTEEVEALVKEKVTEKITEQITARVTELVTNETKARLEKEVGAAVLTDTFKDEAKNKILGKMASGKTMNEAITEVLGEYQATYQAAAIGASITDPNAIQQYIFGQLLSNVFTTEAGNGIQTNVGGGDDLTTALGKVMTSYTTTETGKIVTDEHKAYVASVVTNEKKETYTNKAKAEILTDANKEKVANEVLKKYKDTYISKAKNSVVTDEHQQEVVDEVTEFKKDKYVSAAKSAFGSKIDSITDAAKDEIADIVANDYIKPAYEYAVKQVEAKYPEETEKESFGAAMVAINPDNQVDDQYIDNNEEIPEEYIDGLIDYLSDDITSWSDKTKTNTLSDYIESKERKIYRSERANNAVAMLVAGNLTDIEYKQDILDELADYKVDEEKYDSFGFNYDKCKTIAYEASGSFQKNYDYEISKLSSLNNSNYDEKVQSIKDDVYDSVAGSFLDGLPEDVTSGLEELGTMDLYGLIVGSIFFKMAGLLLPIIYIIMTSNNLIASQIDTGSMAYVLSTSTRRQQVTYTQALYLIGSLLLMFICTTITSCICFSVVDVETELTYSKLLIINLGAFVTMIAVSGINFFTSCIFDRSKRAMAIGGGISIFFLVCTMLGLFGSEVIPAVIRIEALNRFNYASIISLFDVISILDGKTTYQFKLIILLIIALVGYISGSIIFKRKDLPL